MRHRPSVGWLADRGHYSPARRRGSTRTGAWRAAADLIRGTIRRVNQGSPRPRQRGGGAGGEGSGALGSAAPSPPIPLPKGTRGVSLFEPGSQENPSEAAPSARGGGSTSAPARRSTAP